ncbi:MAG: haloacid dehalogenase-like hydrolase [Opitutaceae bacterium]|nr:haloacid dehalogenase-like hydrolase [Opitutaceae bacterium]
MNLLAIFDNDGTICDTQDVEGACYGRAIERVTGRSLSTLDWTTYEEPTSSAIVRDLLAGDPAALTKEEEIKREFVRLLKQERLRFPGDFTPLPGAVEFITRLKEEPICSVAIVTGCFDTSARYKLECCGIALGEFPHATSSDTPRRRDIIPLAAHRAGFPVSSVVYFGDAPWDVRVSGILGVPMIGIGRRIERLRELGVQHTFRDYSDADAIIRVLCDLTKKPRRYLRDEHYPRSR